MPIVTPGNRNKAACGKEFITLVPLQTHTELRITQHASPSLEDHDLPFSQMLPAAAET